MPIEVVLEPRVRQLDPGESGLIPPPWPSSIRWRPSAQVDQWKSLQILSDQNGSLLVFDADSGRHKAHLTATPSDGQRVPGGWIAILCTQPFQANGENAHPFGENAYALYCAPSASLLIRQGGRTIKADVDPRPRLQVDASKIARHADGWLLASPTRVRLTGDLGGLEDRLEIKVEHPAMAQSRRSRVSRLPDGKFTAPLDQLPRDGRFGMAKISVHVKNQNRALYRYRFWYWPSLRGLLHNGIFDAKTIPANLSETFLEYITTSSDGRLCMNRYRDVPYLRAVLAFSVDKSIVSFAIRPKGVSLFVRTSMGEETPMAIGSRLEIKQDRLASHVVIRCPHQSAAIDCKGEIITDPFDMFGLWHRSFAALSTPGANNVVRLLPKGPEEEAVDLFRIGPDPEQRQSTVPESRSRDSDGHCKFETTIAVTATSPGQRISRFTAMVVTGNCDGRLGYGTDTGKSPAVAVRKATQRAYSAMATVQRQQNTIPNPVEGNFGDAYVMLKPAAPGTGIEVANPIRAIVKAAGISDVRGQTKGSLGAMELTRAAFAALRKLVDHDESTTDVRIWG